MDDYFKCWELSADDINFRSGGGLNGYKNGTGAGTDFDGGFDGGGGSGFLTATIGGNGRSFKLKESIRFKYNG
jgi:hypothetical protein